MTAEAPTAAAEPVTPFGAARQAASAAALDASFLSKDERAEMFDKRTPFWIVGASVNKSQFGDRADFRIVYDPAISESGEFKGEARTLSLGYSAFREELVNGLKAILAASKIVGPLYLCKFATASGQMAWDIDETPPLADIEGDSVPGF